MHRSHSIPCAVSHSGESSVGDAHIRNRKTRIHYVLGGVRESSFGVATRDGEEPPVLACELETFGPTRVVLMATRSGAQPDDAQTAPARAATRVLVVASLTEGTGNETTAQRIAAHLSSPAVRVHLLDAHSFDSAAHFEAETRALQPFVFLGVHFVRAGRLCLALPPGVRVLLVAGGTDLNENVKQPEKLAEMRRTKRAP